MSQHFPPDSRKDPGKLRGNRAGPWAVPQFPAGPQEAPADQGLPRLFAWIPNIQEPFELSTRYDDWSRVHLFQPRCTLQLPWTHVLVEILSSCPICAACWSHLVASQGLGAAAQSCFAECRQACGKKLAATCLLDGPYHREGNCVPGGDSRVYVQGQRQAVCALPHSGT